MLNTITTALDALRTRTARELPDGAAQDARPAPRWFARVRRMHLPANFVQAVAVAIILAGAGTVMFGEAQARHGLEERFHFRAALGARFVGAYAADIMERQAEIAELRLADRTVSADAFADVASTFSYEAAVLLDSEGRALHVLPEAPEVVGRDLASAYAHLGSALAGTPSVSNAVASAARGIPIVAFAAPFETPHGRRVLSGGFDLRDTPLSAYLQSAIPFSTASAYLIDANGTIVDSNLDDAASLVGLADANPELAAAIEDRSRGTYSRGAGDEAFVAESVAGTPLRLVLAVPTAQLYEPLGGAALWAPRVLLVLLALATIYVLRVLSALSRSQSALRTLSVELQRSNRELQDFASVASHDLQEPLRKIQAFGDRLSTTYADRLDETGQNYLGRMVAAAERMRSLIDGLLAYSRLASRPYEPQRVDLGRVVTDVLTDLERRIEESGATVSVKAMPTIEADPLQMRQIFQNLVGNALKFVPEGTTPRIDVWADRLATGAAARQDRSDSPDAVGVWRIQVSDNGVGFDERYLDRIFAPFQRLHGRSEFEGTGMGLAICRRIAERHGGTITARSQPGQGTTFVVTLPERQPRPAQGSDTE
jgi:signal transduction histidine kinase